jgi:RNA polymerase sigma-70 factor (ECF subfamily)
MDSIDEIIKQHGSHVTAYVRSMVRDQSMVEDLVQDTFIRVWRYLPSYRGEGSLASWIMTICHNVVVSAVTKKIDIPTEYLHIAAVEDEHNNTDFVSLISRLPIDQRQAVALVLVMGFSYQEAADIMKSPIGTIRSRISRGRDTLREMVLAAENTELPLAQ